jgi:hypothetical protein
MNVYNQFTVNVDHMCLRCPRDHPAHQNMLQIFQLLTPADLHFKPTRIWSRETKRKLLPCLWCVLYTVANPQMVYRGGTQAKNLRKELNKRTPPNAVIVDYEFYKNHSTAEEGWLFIWKV